MTDEWIGDAPSILEIRSLGKSFGELRVLRDISLSVERGSVLSIIGPSGSGKSTLLRCASFLERADEGDILYDGQYALRDGVYASKAELGRFRRRFGLVFQNFQLFPHYSVLKNVAEPPTLQGEDKEQARERARELLKKMGLEGKENAYPYQLSGGQQQRVAIARALAMRPEILFFDEPTGNLDSKNTENVAELLRRCVKDCGQTVVVVTHDARVAAYADRQIGIEDGAIVSDTGE